MRYFCIFVMFSVLYCVHCKGNVKATESMGQEVIEIGTPVKELPPDIDEEPSAELDDDKPVSTTPVLSTTKKETKKTTVETRRANKVKDVDPDEDDARIEKELSEIYKDNADYKDVPETTTAKKNATDKPALRHGSNFKFQPDLNNQREVERFRTSIDDISCGKSVTRLNDRQKLEKKKQLSGGDEALSSHGILHTMISIAMIYIIC